MIDRIKLLVGFYNMSDRSFALKCGLKQNTFCNQISGERGLSLNTVEAILQSCPEISAEWLMRGEGEMLIVNNRSNDAKRMASLVDTISMLSSAIREKENTIRELETKLKNIH